MQEMNGFGLGSNSVFGGRPAMTGSMKKGPKLVRISRVPMRSARRGFQHSDAPFFVQGAGNKMREGLGCNLTLFLHTVHVDSEP